MNARDNILQCRTFRCSRSDKVKPSQKICSRCKCDGHAFKDCTNDIICNFCSEPGHKQKDCTKYKNVQVYGDYAHEICEGRAASLDQSNDDTVRKDDPIEEIQINLHSENAYEDNNKDAEVTDVSKDTENDNSLIEKAAVSEPKTSETTFEALSKERVFLVLGDSNSLRVHFKDPDVKNISISGGSALTVNELLEKAESEAGDKKVKRIAVHLGTNDISRYKSDSNQTILEITTALGKVHEKFPTSEIAFSSIPHRRGKSPVTESLNKTTKLVNEYFLKMAKKESHIYFLSNDDLMKDGIPMKSMYDINDIRGVHLSGKGASVLEENIQSFFDSGSVPGFDFDIGTPQGRKRNRSVMSNTPPSDKQSDKTKKVIPH